MAKFSINIPDGYNKALEEWAEELGDNRGSLVAHLVKLAIGAKYPGKFPQPPQLSGDLAPLKNLDPPALQDSDRFRMLLNLKGREMSAEVLAYEILHGHLVRWKKRHAEMINYSAKRLGLTWEQCYVLHVLRDAPYSDIDIEWAKTQKPITTRAEFENGNAAPGTGDK
ncbi:MAG: hypothetical protein AAGE59_19630 [Cyanobacteria bacterium P01_F01_bin.86]